MVAPKSRMSVGRCGGKFLSRTEPLDCGLLFWHVDQSHYSPSGDLEDKTGLGFIPLGSPAGHTVNLVSLPDTVNECRLQRARS